MAQAIKRISTEVGERYSTGVFSQNSFTRPCIQANSIKVGLQPTIRKDKFMEINLLEFLGIMCIGYLLGKFTEITWNWIDNI